MVQISVMLIFPTRIFEEQIWCGANLTGAKVTDEQLALAKNKLDDYSSQWSTWFIVIINNYF